MAKQALISVTCPCCQAELHIDPATSAVIRHKAHEKPATFSDMEAAVSRFKTEAGRRENAFEKSVADHKVHHDVLSKKFDEMLKLAKENPDEPPPVTIATVEGVRCTVRPFSVRGGDGR